MLTPEVYTILELIKTKKKYLEDNKWKYMFHPGDALTRSYYEGAIRHLEELNNEIIELYTTLKGK